MTCGKQVSILRYLDYLLFQMFKNIQMKGEEGEELKQKLEYIHL